MPFAHLCLFYFISQNGVSIFLWKEILIRMGDDASVFCQKKRLDTRIRTDILNNFYQTVYRNIRQKVPPVLPPIVNGSAILTTICPVAKSVYGSV